MGSKVLGFRVQFPRLDSILMRICYICVRLGKPNLKFEAKSAAYSKNEQFK